MKSIILSVKVNEVRRTSDMSRVIADCTFNVFNKGAEESNSVIVMASNREGFNNYAARALEESAGKEVVVQGYSTILKPNDGVPGNESLGIHCTNVHVLAK